MKKYFLLASAAGLALVILVSFLGTTRGLTQPPEPIQLNINLGEPDSLDPSLAVYLNDAILIEQLFIGLVDWDDETGEPTPELATGWTISSDGLVYTFTLRTDAEWTDSNPVTSQDVKYGILRTLDPATMAGYPNPLFIIENAEDYNTGAITNPNLVGISAPNDSTVIFTLEAPSISFLSLLGRGIARPLPEWAITTHGAAWTDPGNIVTSGPYELIEWVADDHILLEKNTDYYGAAQVQIDEVYVDMESEGTAWTMYLNGQLDTATVPLTVTVTDPTLAHEIRRQVTNCTYYLGFVNNKPPMDDARVRQAFAMAINKGGLIQDVTMGGQTAADQFAPPGMWAAPEIGDVGLGYSPAAAQALLQEYLNEHSMTLADFNALGISLMHNTHSDHASIAAYVEQEWMDNLGVDVLVSDEAWAAYLNRLNKSTPLVDAPHIYRMAWCGDLPDESTWVHAVMNNQVGANRMRRGCVDDTCTVETPLAFDMLTFQAEEEQDPITRNNLYLQAERLLAETEAAYIPLYFYGTFVATKPYLERTYPTFQVYDISNWQITLVSEVIEPAGGSLTSFDASTNFLFPAGAFTDTVIITQGPAPYLPPGDNLIGIGHNFAATAVYSATSQNAGLAPGQTFTITVSYDQNEVGAAKEETLSFYYWEDGWVLEPNSILDTEANTLVVNLNHFSVWAVLGETNRTYLPAGLRQHP